jgi:hypothetical protein
MAGTHHKYPDIAASHELAWRREQFAADQLWAAAAEQQQRADHLKPLERAI